MKKIAVIIAIVFAVACTAKKATTTVAAPSAESIVENGAKRYPGYTFADFEQGKSLYEGNCGNCHGLKKPSSRNEAEWKHEVADMAPKANRKAGKMVIGDKEQELIVKYLVAAGSMPKPGK